MRVHINGEFMVECSHLLPDRWNGWVQPVFTEEQMNEVNESLRWLTYLGEDETPEGWLHIGEGEWTTSGWCWEVVGE